MVACGYVPLRCWLDSSRDVSTAGVTPFVAAACSREECKLRAETNKELQSQWAASSAHVHSESTRRHKRLRWRTELKFSQRQADDFKTAQLQEDIRQQSTIRLSEQEQMLEDIMQKRHLERKLQADSLCSSGLADDNSVPSIGWTSCSNGTAGRQRDAKLYKTTDSILKEAAAKAHHRQLEKADRMNLIAHEIGEHNKRQASAPHSARMAYFRFGATGHYASGTSRKHSKGAASEKPFVKPPGIGLGRPATNAFISKRHQVTTEDSNMGTHHTSSK